MPNQTLTCLLDVVFAQTVNQFPATGDREKLYFDESSGDYEEGEGDVYYWDGSEYQKLTVGPRPRKPPIP